jgi:DNA polymerase III subunit delta'
MSKFIDEIVGNEKVKKILKSMMEYSNIPHALLFSGSEGVGKENTAICFAKAINSIESDSEEQKKIISLINKLSEPYIKYIQPLPRGKNEIDQNDPYEKLSVDDIESIRNEFEKKSVNSFYKMEISRANLIKINSIREIKKFLSLNYDDIKYRVIIISQAHLMNEEAQNALLKNLEEPPDGVIFILCTSFPEKLRETIRSRCWSIHFQPLNDFDLFYILTEHFKIDKNLAKEVTPFANGSVQEAKLLLDNDFEELREKTIRILRNAFARRYQSTYLEFEDALSESDQIKIKLLIKMILIWLNDLQKFRLNKIDNLFFTKHKDTLEKFNTKFPDIEIRDVADKLDRISSYLKNNINLNVAVSNTIFQLSSLIVR